MGVDFGKTGLILMRILIIDNNPLFFDGLQQAVSRPGVGIEAVGIGSGEQALRLLENDSGVDLILAELDSPGMGGFAFLAELPKRGFCIPVTIISSLDDPHLVLRVIQEGALGFIPKSFSADSFLDAIQSLLRGKTYIPAALRTEVQSLRNSLGCGSEKGVASVEHGLTPRQISVLKLLNNGFSNKKIALSLNLSEHTVKSHMKALFVILSVTNRTECVQKATRMGLVA